MVAFVCLQVGPGCQIKHFRRWYFWTATICNLWWCIVVMHLQWRIHKGDRGTCPPTFQAEGAVMQKSPSTFVVCLYRSKEEETVEVVVRDGVSWSAARRSDNDRLSVEQVGRTLHCLRLSRRYTQRLRPPAQPSTISARRTRPSGPSSHVYHCLFLHPRQGCEVLRSACLRVCLSVDDVMISLNGTNGPESAYVSSSSPVAGTGGVVCRLRLISLTNCWISFSALLNIGK